MNRIQDRLGRATPLIGVLIIVIIVALLCAGLYVGDRYAEAVPRSGWRRRCNHTWGRPGHPRSTSRASHS